MTPTRCLLAAAIAGAVVSLRPAPAHGFVKDFFIASLSPDTVVLDGSADDWYEAGYPCMEMGGQSIVTGEQSWTGDEDYSISACLAYDDAAVTIALDVRDDRQVRTKRPTSDEDHVEIWIDRGSEEDVDRTVIHFYPERKFPTFHPYLRRITDKGKKRPIKGAKFTMESHHDGWTAEIVLPLASLSLWRDLVASRWALVGVDSDTAEGDPAVETVLASRGVLGGGTLDSSSIHTELVTLEDVQAVLETFAGDQGLNAASLDLGFADLAGDDRLEVVAAAGPLYGILGPGFMSCTSYTYLTLPVDSPDDVHSFVTRDVTGNGKQDVIVRYTEHNELGSRRMIAIYSFMASELRRVLAQETAVIQGSRSIRCKASFVEGGPGGSEMLLVSEPEAEGWSEISYANVPEYGVGAVLTPWSQEQRRLWAVQGLDYEPVAPAKIDVLLSKKTKKKKHDE
jgi:hypothetical protein